MKEDGLLVGLAQIGLGYAAFAGLIGLFRRTQDGLSEREAAGVRLMLEHTIALLLASMIPLLAYHAMSLSETNAWRASSLSLACFLSWEFLTQFRQSRDLASRGQGLAFPRLFVFGFYLPGCATLVLQVLNVIVGAFGLYFVGLFWLLIPPTFQFWAFAAYWSRRDA